MSTFRQTAVEEMAERKPSVEALGISDGHFRQLFESAQDGILILDAATGEIIAVNPFCVNLLGYSQEECLGEKLWKLCPFGDLAVSKSLFAELQDKECVRYEDVPLETKKGKPIVVEFISNAYFVDSQKVIQCNIRDITERRLAEEKLKDYLEHLADTAAQRTKELKETQEKLSRKEKLATLGCLAGGVAHELRNPLGAIGNSIYYLKMRLTDADEKVLKHLDLIQNEIEVSNTIITDLLEFSKCKMPKVENRDVNAIVSEKLNHIHIPEAITVTPVLEAHLPLVLVDADQIKLVFRNLIYNAFQAMPEGGRLEIRTELGDGFVRIQFKDTGKGIPEDHLHKIFEPLFTTKATGIGLGLSLVKEIVERHHGRIEVASEIGKGTIFTVLLPYNTEET